LARRPSHRREVATERPQRVAPGTALPKPPSVTLERGATASLLDPDLPPESGSPPPPGSARAFLRRICDGDPLGLALAVRERMAARALLVEPALVGDKVAARAAFEMACDGRWQDAPERLREWIDRGLAREVEDQRAALEYPIPSAPGPFLAAVAERVGLDALLMNEGAVVFNGLPTSVRHAFYATFVRGQSTDDLVATGHADLATIRRRLRCALLSIARLRPSEVDPQDRSSSDE